MADADGDGATAETSIHRAVRLSDLVRYQKPMVRVLVSLIPAFAGSVYFFGWRALAILTVSVVVACVTEWLFCRSRREPVSSAVFVTAALYALILPPRVPYMVLVVGIVVAVAFGKEVFGGYGRNVFNPALVGRCFVYVCFPRELTAHWLPAYVGWPAGLSRWVMSADAVTSATPLTQYKAGEAGASLTELLLGNVGGCLGETSALLILAGAAYLLATKTASWRIVVSCIAGCMVGSAAFHYSGAQTVPAPVYSVLSGGFLFGAVFMATDPISAAQTNEGRFIYGAMVGLLTVIIRGFSSWPEGIMFAILLMNIFNPIIDHVVREYRKLKRERAKAAKAGAS